MENLKKFEWERDRNFKWNFLVNILDLSFYSLGMSFVNVTTILPAFIWRLTSSHIIVGLFSSLGSLANAIPQIFIANLTRRLSVNKPLVVLFGFGERIYWLLLAIITFFFYSSPEICLLLFIIIYVAGNFSTGAATVPWWNMIAKIMGEKKGLFFGLSSLLGGFLGVVGATISAQIFYHSTFPYSFILSFLMAFSFTFISWIFLTLTREPPYPMLKEQDVLRYRLKDNLKILKDDENFRLFVIAATLSTFSNMAIPFYTVFAMKKFRLLESDAALFTTMLLCSSTMPSPLLGYLGDKKGYKLFLETGIAASILSPLLAILANSKYLFLPVFIFIGYSISVERVCLMSIVPNFCAPRNRPIYLGLISTIRTISLAFTPLLGGLIITYFGHDLLFILTASITTLGLSFLKFVEEPKIST